MAELLDDEIKTQIKEIFNQMQHPVQVLFFGRKDDCEYCDETRQLVEEIIPLSEKLSLSVYDLDEDQAVARQYRVDKAPSMVIAGRDGEEIIDYGIRLSGIPAGHEFATLIHDLVLASGRDSGLSQQTRELLNEIQTPVSLQVFVTPT